MLALHKTHTPHRVFLKMNSGMNRLGLRPAAYRNAWARLNALPQVEEITHMTHFSDADGPLGVAHQVRVFDAATRDLPGERSLSNSAAILRHAAAPDLPHLAADWVRPGVAIYGSSPDFPAHDIAHWGLMPAMTLSSRVIGVQALQAGKADVNAKDARGWNGVDHARNRSDGSRAEVLKYLEEDLKLQPAMAQPQGAK